RFVEGNRELRKSLGIAKSAQIDNKIRCILQASSEKEIAEGEKFMKSLKTRASTKLCIEILATIVKVATIIITGLLLFTTPIAALVAVSIVVTVIGVALLASEKVLINKDHARPPKDVWYDKALHRVRTTLYNTGTRLRKTIQKSQPLRAGSIVY